MSSRAFKGVIGGFIAGSLLLGSTVASASPNAARNVIPHANSWLVLSAMSGGAGATAICGAAAAAAVAQGPTGCVLPAMDAPPPPPPVSAPPPVPVEAPSAGLGFSPLLFGLLALAAGVGIAVALSHHDHSNSPA